MATDGAQPVEGLGLRPGTALAWTAAAVAAVTVGIALYVWRAPSVEGGIVNVELGGGGQSLTDTADIKSAVLWDFVLILGYGAALVIALLVLARHVFWSPRGQGIVRLAAFLSFFAIGCDVIENLLLLVAVRDTPAGPDRLLDVVAAAAVVKFCCLVPAAVVAAGAVGATWSRTIGSRSGNEAIKKLKVVGPWPLEDEPGTRRVDRAADDEAGRWRRGYLVPDFGHDDLRDRVKTRDLTGFCLSGGGIRSGSVALGALQALRPELLKADYLVSVSGGGYVAGALQLTLTGEDPTEDPGGTVERRPKQAFMPGSVEEDRFRRHADYIVNSTGQTIVALAVVARGLVLSLTVLFGPAIVLGWLAGRAYDHVPLVEWNPDEIDPTAPGGVGFPDVQTGTLIAVAALATVAVGVYAALLVISAYTGAAIETMRNVSRALTAVALLVAGLAVGLPAAIFASAWLLEKTGSTELAVGGSLTTVLLSYGATIAALSRQRKVRERVGGLFSKQASSPVAAVPTGILQRLFVLLALAALAAAWLVLFGGVASVASATSPWVVGCVALGLVGLGGVLDQTTMSLHPFYRRRLADAFSMRRVRRSDGHTVAISYPYSERTTLSDYGERPKGFPQVVFAAAANLTGEDRAPLGAVSFTFTDEWVGGPDIGYLRTKDVEEVLSSHQLQRDLTVQAAVAISGAAVASAMGRQGRWYSALLAVTGARLGTWLPNPHYVANWQAEVALGRSDWWRIAKMPRVRRLPYLVREVINRHTIRDRLLQVTDGGHYENLGFVELLRRRCTTIYCIDASGDSPPTAGTLASAISLAEAELGVRIELDTPFNMVPGSGDPLAEGHPLAALHSRLSPSAVVTGRVFYPAESGLPDGSRTGRLVVAKALLTDDMDYDLLAYAARNGVFPRDSTSDQFFNDDKFCAYRALGRELGERARVALART